PHGTLALVMVNGRVCVERVLCRMPATRREIERVPEVMLVALVVSVVAEGAKATLLVLVTVTTPVPVLIVASPEAVKPPKTVPPLLNSIWPAEPPGTPVRTEVETWPGMPPAIVPQMVFGEKTPLHWASAATGARMRARARRSFFIIGVGSIHQFQEWASEGTRRSWKRGGSWRGLRWSPRRRG